MHLHMATGLVRRFRLWLFPRLALGEEAPMTRDDDKCPECGGSGSIKHVSWYPGCSYLVTGATCPTCNGTGKRRETEPKFSRQLLESVKEWT